MKTADFIADKIVMDGLTYDDVLLVPAYSEVLPRTVQLSTKFSRNIDLHIPFVTAAMDTVTESAMAIAIAREGGIGVIHKNMSIEEQARQVAIVKRAENGMIYDPVTIQRGRTVGDALALMAEYHIGGIPVVDDDKHLVGIVTNRDLRFERDLNKLVEEVMTSENLVTTTQQADLAAATLILQENKIEKLPVVDKDGRLVGLITYKDITKAKDKPMACKDSKGRLRVAAGVGVTADTMERMNALIQAGADAIVIDTAHGHSKFVIEKLREAKATFSDVEASLIGVTDGYYAFINAFPNYENYQHELKAMTVNVKGHLAWGKYSESDPSVIFKVTSLGDGTYSIQNVASGRYIADGGQLSAKVLMTDAQEVPQVFNIIAGSSQWNITNTGSGIAYHTEGHLDGNGLSGDIVNWDGGANGASAWVVKPITDEAIIAAAIQNGPAKLLGNKLQTYLDTANQVLPKVYDYV